jgi:copper chaperone CopZ
MKWTFVAKFSVLFALAACSLLLDSGGIIGKRTRSPAFGHGTALARENGMAKAVFKVKCYDEGREALRGLKGIQRIETGFHDIHETDTVSYDPKVITIDEMEAALKKAGTFVGTVSGKERD